MVEKGKMSPRDPSSFSRPELAVVRHIKIELSVSFQTKKLSGNVLLSVEKLDDSVSELILDAKDLKIHQITETELKVPLNFTLGDVVESFGSKLTIQLPKKENTKLYEVQIEYETSPKASGLQWLEPEQTSGKLHPFVFSQFQPIHARSVIPCQDTPGVKTAYSAEVEVDSHLTVVMSAIKTTTEDKPGPRKRHHFSQVVPVPSYLIAIAVGDLERRDLGPHCYVYAEPNLIEESAEEFSGTKRQLDVAEELCGPYEWGEYGLLVLPPSFPFGGMENPCLTFVTPTLLAGDKSLVNVVAHEIAHSWTGNLVTNRNFEHFWLNEGFTVFIERKILGRLTSPQQQDFEAYCGTVELRQTISDFGETNPLTQLVVDLSETHPDDSFSRVPYEKGHTFLRYLEQVVGGPEVFEKFLRDYFQNFKFKSIDTDDFKSFFEDRFPKHKTEIDWNKWLYSPGMPPIVPEYDNNLLKVCTDYTERLLNWNTESPIDLSPLTTVQIIQLLQNLFEAEPMPIKKLKAFEAAFKFGSITNAEIKFQWLRICLKAHWEEKIAPTLEWLNEVGRMKYSRPLYRDLYAWESARSRAVENYKENAKYMMHVSAYTLAKDLHLSA